MKNVWRLRLSFASSGILSFLLATGSSLDVQPTIPVPIIFETDMGNDIDDALALAMLYRYEQEGKIELLGVSNNKQSIQSVRYIDAINTWYGYGHTPIGTVQNGVQGEDEANSFAFKVMAQQFHGQHTFYSSINQYEQVRSSVSMYREILSKQADNSAVIISVGFLTNLEMLLQSEPDRFSTLNGKELVSAKVNRLVVMGGSVTYPTHKEFNLKTDVTASQYVFDQWPGEVWITPFEVGEHLVFPAGPIEENLGYQHPNPLVEGYKLYIPMPYDRPTWDLTAVLFAVEADSGYFRASNRGKMVVNADATTQFEFAANGIHRYLEVPTAVEAARIQNRYVELVRSSRKASAKADPTAFKLPSAHYRPLRILHEPPDTQTLIDLHDWGYGGVVTNVSYRNYLNDPLAWGRFRDVVRRAIDSLNLRVWIYDEAGYPSGAAGGEVLKQRPGLEALGLAVITRQADVNNELVIDLPHGHLYALTAIAEIGEPWGGSRTVDLRPWVDKKGTLRWKAPSEGWTVHYFATKSFYENTHATNNWYAQRKMVNLLEPQVGDAFVESTHEKYSEVVGDYFGEGIEALFTDEPAMVGVHFLENPPPVTPQKIDSVDGRIPAYPTLNWSRSLLMEFRNRRGYDLLPEVHHLVGNWSPRAAKVRVDYYATLSEMVAEYYFKPLQKFGARNGIASSGHLLLEEDIFYHPLFHGNIQDQYRHMQYPGIDLLTAFPHVAKTWGVTTAKLASSVADQYHRPHVMSEISNAFDSEEAGINGVLAAIGVQYAFGVDKFTSYYRHDKFSDVENQLFTGYVGRVGYLLSKGTRQPLLDVYYPIESMYALTEVPLSLAREYFNEEALTMSDNFKQVGLTLVDHQLDFNYVDKKRVLEVGTSKSPLIVPTLNVLDKELLEKFRYLAEEGKPIAFQQKKVWLLVPGQGEAIETDLSRYFAGMDHVFFGLGPKDLADWARSRVETGYQLDRCHDDFVSLYKKGAGEDIYLLVNTASTDRSVNLSLADSDGKVRIWDPLTGKVKKAHAEKAGDGWRIPLHFQQWQTLLLTVDR